MFCLRKPERSLGVALLSLFLFFSIFQVSEVYAAPRYVLKARGIRQSIQSVWQRVKLVKECRNDVKEQVSSATKTILLRVYEQGSLGQKLKAEERPLSKAEQDELRAVGFRECRKLWFATQVKAQKQIQKRQEQRRARRAKLSINTYLRSGDVPVAEEPKSEATPKEVVPAVIPAETATPGYPELAVVSDALKASAPEGTVSAQGESEPGVLASLILAETCDASMTIELLAAEFSWGVGGPHLGVFGSCLKTPPVGDPESVPLFGGADLNPTGSEPSLVDTMTLPAGWTAELFGTGEIQLGTTPPTNTFGSENQTQALVLVNGDHLPTMLAPFGLTVDSVLGNPQTQNTQLSVGEALDGYFNIDTGFVTIANNEVLVLFELGTTVPGRFGYDLQDLVLLIRTEDNCPVETVVKDTLTDDLNWLNTYALGGVITKQLPFPSSSTRSYVGFNPPQNGCLKELSFIASHWIDEQPINDGNASSIYIDRTVDLAVYGSFSELSAAPQREDAVLPINLAAPGYDIPIGVTENGSFGGGPINSGNLYKSTYDLSSFNLPVVAGQTNYIGISNGGAAGSDTYLQRSRGLGTVIGSESDYMLTNQLPLTLLENLMSDTVENSVRITVGSCD